MRKSTNVNLRSQRFPIPIPCANCGVLTRCQAAILPGPDDPQIGLVLPWCIACDHGDALVIYARFLELDEAK